MGESRQDLRLRASLEGGKETAKGLQEIDRAQEGLTGKVDDSTKRIEDATEAQQKLNAAESDYISILSRIDPQFAGFVDSLLKGSKVAGDFASAQFTLGDATATVTAAIAAQAGTLKLLGAVGIAAAGIGVLAKSIQQVRGESQKLREEIESLRGEQTSAEQALIGLSERVVSAARRRPEGGLSAEQQAAASEAIRVARDKDITGDIELLTRNLAALAGLLSGREIEALTRAGIEIPIDLPADVRRRAAERHLRDPATAERQRREEERVEAARARDRERAARELLNPERGSANIDRLLDRIAPGIDRGEVLGLIREFIKLRSEDFQVGGGLLSPHLQRTGELSVQELLNLARERRGGFFAGGGTPREIEAAADLIRETGIGTTVINNHFQNSRLQFPDRGSQQRAITNGVTVAIAAER